MKVTNNTVNPMVLGGTFILPGATEEVDAWDELKDTAPVKAFVKGEAISVAKTKATAAKPEDEERTALFAELDKLEAKYDKKATTPDLLIVLDEAKKKAAAK